jgi:probable HAF family extracellular repeat protein
MNISKALVTALLSACALSTAQAQYTVQNLGRLPGTADAYGFTVNSTGAVAGRALGAGDRAFLYSAGTMLDLGTLPGGIGAIAYDLNDAGQVVGDSSSGVGARAFIYSAGVMSSIGTLGGAGSSAGGINNVGQIVGWSHSPAGDQAFLYPAGTMAGLGSLPGTSFSVATEIADNGIVIRHSGNAGPGGSIQGFTYASGVMSGFGPTDSGQSTRPEGINELGTVVGRTTAWGGYGGTTTGPRDGNLAFSFSGGVLSQLPAVPGSTSSGA